MKGLSSKFIMLLACLSNMAFAANPVQTQIAKLNKVPVNSIQTVAQASNQTSSVSLQPQVLNLSQQTVPMANIVAMWKTPIPYLSVGYTIANINYTNNNPSVTVNNNSYSGVSLKLSGF